MVSSYVSKNKIFGFVSSNSYRHLCLSFLTTCLLRFAICTLEVINIIVVVVVVVTVEVIIVCLIFLLLMSLLLLFFIMIGIIIF